MFYAHLETPPLVCPWTPMAPQLAAHCWNIPILMLGICVCVCFDYVENLTVLIKKSSKVLFMTQECVVSRVKLSGWAINNIMWHLASDWVLPLLSYFDYKMEPSRKQSSRPLEYLLTNTKLMLRVDWEVIWMSGSGRICRQQHWRPSNRPVWNWRTQCVRSSVSSSSIWPVLNRFVFSFSYKLRNCVCI